MPTEFAHFPRREGLQMLHSIHHKHIRPQWTRFVNRFIEKDQEEAFWDSAIRAALIMLSGIAGFIWLFFGSRWHTSTTYIYVNDVHLPWKMWGAIFLMQAAFLTMPMKLRLVGYVSGFMTCAFFGILLFAAALMGYTSSPLGFSGLLAFAVIHLAGTRNYIFKQTEQKEREKNGLVEG